MSQRPEPLRAALAQVNSTVGDLTGNAERIAAAIDAARAEQAHVVVFPELALTGYPPEDLLLKTHFLEATGDALESLATHARDVVAIVGFPESAGDTYNAAAVLAEGRVAGVYRKMHLPNYGVFDEQRYFQAGATPATIEVNGIQLGLTVCEDLWMPGPPASTEALAGARVIVNLSASPYHAGKAMERERMLVQRARDYQSAVLFCNAVGGQDELVFDGQSLALDQEGRVIARAPQFEESLTVCTLDPGTVTGARLRDTRRRADVRAARRSGELAAVQELADLEVPGGPTEVGGPVAEILGPEAEVYGALRTGLRDYADKNGFDRVVFGLSGGIDSALVAMLAVDALGPDRVTCVVMPSTYSTDATQSDARTIAQNLGTDLVEIAIEPAMEAYEGMLADTFAGTEPDLTEENLQARIRGNLVMALSNKYGWLVLTTGNKSELSVGYATLYGDMAGGFAVLKDVFKGWVYRLVQWRNDQEGRELVPTEVLTRPPSAELRHEQRDDQSLPPYDVLDGILAGYIEEDLDAGHLVSRGYSEEDVDRTIAMVDRAEYKRRQAPPGIRISTRAFGRDRRLPITSRYRTRVSRPEPV
ncbi:MAG TPA: NAD+ synthase [Thermoleophilaceae bacterium]|nr:NAD+ synthase [Thermoleophilaceae bacterium]